MAGLTAAHRLHQAGRQAFDLTILEGSNRVGGRIQTAILGGDQVELGATLIHGITGSPVYEIAQRIGALSVDTPRENYQNRFDNPLFCAEGTHLPVDAHLLYPSIDLFRSSMALVNGKGVGQSLPLTDVSVGAFLQQRLSSLLLEQASMHTDEAYQIIRDTGSERRESSTEDGEILVSSTAKSQEEEGCNPRKGDEMCGMWNPLLLQESVFLSLEALERSKAACNSLKDLDLASFKEYTEFPGPHVTIGKGYVSVLKELENSLPAGTVKLGKKVQKIFWNNSHPSMCAPVVLHCEDGSVVEADHAILTMSLGVLKAGVSKSASLDSSPICRSAMDLRGWKASKDAQANELFEPSLPRSKVDAISCLGFGVVNKLFLLLDPAADKSLLTEITFLHHKNSESVPSWLRRTFSMFPIYRGSNVVLLWMSGEEALQMEALSDDEVLDGVAQMLASFRLGDKDEGTDPDRKDIHGHKAGTSHDLKQRLRSMFKGVLRSKWATNPLCQGSYSFVAVGSSGNDIDELAKPLPRECNGADLQTEGSPGQIAKVSPLQLLFAGEATHRNFYSTTHGAFLSGIREADRLLKYTEKGSQLS